MARPELRRWTPAPGARSSKGFGYFAFVPDPIASRRFDLDLHRDLLQEAEGELRALAGEPRLAPLASHLFRLEALASLRLSGEAVSLARLYRSLLRPGRRPDPVVGPVLRLLGAQRRVLEQASSARAFSLPELLHLHRAILAGLPEAGHLRSVQTWLGGSRASPRSADFIPAPPERVRPLMEDLAAFLSRSDLPPIGRAALAVGQLLTVRPFLTANGRLARLLVHGILVRSGLSTSALLPLSSALWARPAELPQALQAFREEKPEEMARMLAGALLRAAQGVRRFLEKRALFEEGWGEFACLFRSHAAGRRLLACLFAEGVLDGKSVQRALSCSDEAARLALRRLCELGFLKPITPGRRNRLFAALGFFPLLHDLDKSLGRGPAGLPSP